MYGICCIRAKPYKRKSINTIALYSLFTLQITVIFSLILNLREDQIANWFRVICFIIIYGANSLFIIKIVIYMLLKVI